MISLASSVLNTCKNIFPFKIRIVLKNFLKSCSATKQIENVCYSNPHSTDTRMSPALSVINRDSPEPI